MTTIFNNNNNNNNNHHHRCRRMYHVNIVEHYENPRNVGSLDASDNQVGTGLVGAPACGDVMKLQIKVDENGKIVDSKFKVNLLLTYIVLLL